MEPTLGCSDPQKVIKMHVDAEDKLGERIVLSGQYHDVVIINEEDDSAKCGLIDSLGRKPVQTERMTVRNIRS